MKKPRILLLDIETAPIVAHVWRLFDENVSLNQIKKDWHLISFAAKWLGEDEVIYMDQRDVENIEDDKKLLRGMWRLLNKADVIITQNGKNFDIKKLNARFIIHGFKPPASYKHIDTYQIAKKHFGFTSNKLEYMAEKLTVKRKLTQRLFNGFELWKECLSGNPLAWDELAIYNKQDVIVLEEVYKKLMPWDGGINFSLYDDHQGHVCECGSTSFQRRGYHYTLTGKYRRYRCNDCGAWSRSRKNMLTAEKKKSIRVRIGE